MYFVRKEVMILSRETRASSKSRRYPWILGRYDGQKLPTRAGARKDGYR